ncbi:winged helix-turn-helix domain-containing protein [Ralstonia insidiosa]|uniref:winged helix-turn-helix domain-containing protein n=1 Tax=Ralstonia insidiosa TaxID=190721 RepID=UPI0009EE442C|nr:winged helix-turn-helix domain-containing protein [Ralstonia insidiosa]KAB0469830.1 response regulator [Ralstonia insidiosa]MBY4910543.1 winged helix-turn-helix domain-containing protein [Ralstonia insidiosa]
MGKQILLVEQDQAERERLLSSLRGGGHVVQRVDDVERVSAAAQFASLDLLVMDWAQPKNVLIDTLLALRTSKHICSLPVIVLSHFDDIHTRIAALDAGADDYMVKPCDMGELHARIRAVLRRRMPQPPVDEIPQVRGLQLDPLTLGVTVQIEAGIRAISLSPLEFRLLHFLVMHPNRVHARAQLLDRVWGEHIFIGERTVDVHVRKLRAALAGTACDGLIQTVRGGGYRLVADADAGSEVQSKQVIGVQAEVVMDQPELRHAARSVPDAVNVAVQKAAVTRWGKPSRKAATGARHHPD